MVRVSLVSCSVHSVAPLSHTCAAFQVTVFAVNYKGAPFMNGLARNNLLLGALASVAVGAAVAAANLLPVLNSWCVWVLTCTIA